MIHCGDCSTLRRGQGGIKIGGRALPTVATLCPCLSLERAVLLEPVPVVLDIPTFLGSSYAIFDYPMRVCPGEGVLFKPFITSVAVPNYPSGDLSFEALSRIYGGITEGCTYDGFSSPMAYCNNVDGVIFDSGTALQPTTSGDWLYAYNRITVAFPYDLGDVPILELTYNYSPSL